MKNFENVMILNRYSTFVVVICGYNPKVEKIEEWKINAGVLEIMYHSYYTNDMLMVMNLPRTRNKNLYPVQENSGAGPTKIYFIQCLSCVIRKRFDMF